MFKMKKISEEPCFSSEKLLFIWKQKFFTALGLEDFHPTFLHFKVKLSKQLCGYVNL